MREEEIHVISTIHLGTSIQIKESGTIKMTVMKANNLKLPSLRFFIVRQAPREGRGHSRFFYMRKEKFAERAIIFISEI